VADFISRFGSLQQAYRQARKGILIPLRLEAGETVYLSPGAHNLLQVAIIEQFGPRFAPGARVLYIGDTALKHVVCDTAR
jgi:type II restriction enzyme